MRRSRRLRTSAGRTRTSSMTLLSIVARSFPGSACGFQRSRRKGATTPFARTTARTRTIPTRSRPRASGFGCRSLAGSGCAKRCASPHPLGDDRAPGRCLVRELRHRGPLRTGSAHRRLGGRVDLGISALATLSDGSDPIPAPKPLRGYLAKLKRLSRAVSRKQRGSNNRAKAKIKLARLHRRIAAIRADALHKLTTSLTRYRTIVIEDLNVSGMRANRHLARAIADLGLSEFRRQLEYKAAMASSMLIVADRWYPSSKLCSACSAKNESLTLSDRTWTCTSCGAFHDRDVNAARNLARYPESWAGSACGADGSGGEEHLTVKPAA